MEGAIALGTSGQEAAFLDLDVKRLKDFQQLVPLVCGPHPVGLICVPVMQSKKTYIDPVHTIHMRASRYIGNTLPLGSFRTLIPASQFQVAGDAAGAVHATRMAMREMRQVMTHLALRKTVSAVRTTRFSELALLTSSM